MPIITLHVSCHLAADRQSHLASRLVAITTSILGKKRELVVVNIAHGERQGTWYVAGARTDDAIFQLSISITKGSNTDEEKSRWIESAYGIISLFILGNVQVNYITVNEISGTNWGYNGLTQASRMSPRTGIESREADK